jgi:hypothetical protein
MLGIHRIAFNFLVTLGAMSLVILSNSAPAQLLVPDNSALPAGVIKKGSLANQKLILDAGVVAAAKLATKGYHISRNQPFTPYVLSMPEGSPGERTWAERWYYTIDDKQVPVTIDFKESGAGAADFTIRNEP